ncbi:hypothetical protein D5b_00003 [Faustovirus]|nr:hypothetical protein D5b_00003 [Faustovirus]AMN84905.1 hypothetical protein D6_00507 [Faustovirus]AMP43964.1 hypothetical protein PRJ_Dakar_00003 [Faustovirus]
MDESNIVLPIEIWREIGLCHWGAYKTTVKLNKTFNTLLKNVDIKSLFARYVEGSRYGGWILPDSKWLTKWELKVMQVTIWRFGRIFKTYGIDYETHHCVTIQQIYRYAYNDDDDKWREHVYWVNGKMLVERAKYRGKYKLATDNYISSNDNILHWRAMSGSSSSCNFKLKYRDFFLYGPC